MFETDGKEVVSEAKRGHTGRRVPCEHTLAMAQEVACEKTAFGPTASR